MKKTVILFERGISGWQSIVGDWFNWPNEAIAWSHQNTDFRGQTLTYFTGPILAGLTRRYRAANFARLISKYDGWNIRLVAHSEGTATTLEAIQLCRNVKIEQVHLLCGACDANFERNNLNNALYVGQVIKVFCYRGGKDMAMRIENTLLGKFFFQVDESDKPLGLVGPQNVRPSNKDKIGELVWPDFGHSFCWLPKNFVQTMRHFVLP